jgi:hypothetical protein
MAALENRRLGMPVLNVFFADPKGAIHIDERGIFGELSRECLRIFEVPGSHQTGDRIFGAGLGAGASDHKFTEESD